MHFWERILKNSQGRQEKLLPTINCHAFPIFKEKKHINRGYRILQQYAKQHSSAKKPIKKRGREGIIKVFRWIWEPPILTKHLFDYLDCRLRFKLSSIFEKREWFLSRTPLPPLNKPLQVTFCVTFRYGTATCWCDSRRGYIITLYVKKWDWVIQTPCNTSSIWTAALYLNSFRHLNFFSVFFLSGSTFQVSPPPLLP